jgi:hypothetical protein
MIKMLVGEEYQPRLIPHALNLLEKKDDSSQRSTAEGEIIFKTVQGHKPGD